MTTWSNPNVTATLCGYHLYQVVVGLVPPKPRSSVRISAGISQRGSGSTLGLRTAARLPVVDAPLSVAARRRKISERLANRFTKPS
jgi:hypothetical protein